MSPGPTPELAVVELAATETHDLRRRVLRDGTPSDRVDFDGDDESCTVHLGVRAGQQLVAVSTWTRRRYPDLPQSLGVQIRGMATEPAARGIGAGSLLLSAGVARAIADGVEVVWARARDDALEFYERHGFETVGAGYVDLATGLAHHDIVRQVGPAAD